MQKLLTSKLDKLINGDAGLGIVRTELKQYFIVSLQDIARLEIYLNVTDVDEEIRQLFQAIGSQLRERSKSYGFAGVADACGEFLKAVKKSVNIAEKLKTVKKEFLVLWERVLPALGRVMLCFSLLFVCYRFLRPIIAYLFKSSLCLLFSYCYVL